MELFFFYALFPSIKYPCIFEEETGSISQVAHWDETEEYGSRSVSVQRETKTINEREKGVGKV